MKRPRGLSGRDAAKALPKAGFRVCRQKGSHIYLRKEGWTGRFIAVPNHPAIAAETLSAIIRQAGLTREEFLKLL